MYKILGADHKEYGPVVAEQIFQWIAERRVIATTLIQVEGSAEWRPVSTVPEFAEVLRRVSPPLIGVHPPPPQAEETGDTIAKVIPFKNPKALWAYYLGIFSFIPGLGILLGLTAMVLGIQGLLFANKNPGVRGHVHAWVGIALGGFFGLGYLAVLIVLMGTGLLANR